MVKKATYDSPGSPTTQLDPEIAKNRVKQYAQVDDMFLERWSPRAFLPDSIPQDELSALFEAARWSPSSFNEQPWLFKVAHKGERLKQYQALLTPGNQKWATLPPVLVILFSKKRFAKTNAPNKSSQLDGGAAWMTLAYQARKQGLYAHAMAGFDREKAFETAGVSPEDYDVLCMIAIGYKGNPDILPDDLKQSEHPNTRKPLADILDLAYSDT